MAGIVERGVGHVGAMDGGGILDRIDEVEKLDKVARRTFGLNDIPSSGFTLNVLSIDSLGVEIRKN
jgi:hypothetical protein